MYLGCYALHYGIMYVSILYTLYIQIAGSHLWFSPLSHLLWKHRRNFFETLHMNSTQCLDVSRSAWKWFWSINKYGRIVAIFKSLIALYYIPRKLCLWGVYCFHVVHPSIRLSVRDVLVFQYLEKAIWQTHWYSQDEYLYWKIKG